MRVSWPPRGSCTAHAAPCCQSPALRAIRSPQQHGARAVCRLVFEGGLEQRSGRWEFITMHLAGVLTSWLCGLQPVAHSPYVVDQRPDVGVGPPIDDHPKHLQGPLGTGQGPLDLPASIFHQRNGNARLKMPAASKPWTGRCEGQTQGRRAWHGFPPPTQLVYKLLHYFFMCLSLCHGTRQP